MDLRDLQEKRETGDLQETTEPPGALVPREAKAARDLLDPKESRVVAGTPGQKAAQDPLGPRERRETPALKAPGAWLEKSAAKEQGATEDCRGPEARRVSWESQAGLDLVGTQATWAQGETQGPQDQRETEADLASATLAPEDLGATKARRGLLVQRVDGVTRDRKAIPGGKETKGKLATSPNPANPAPEVNQAKRATRGTRAHLEILA